MDPPPADTPDTEPSRRRARSGARRAAAASPSRARPASPGRANGGRARRRPSASPGTHAHAAHAPAPMRNGALAQKGSTSPPPSPSPQTHESVMQPNGIQYDWDFWDQLLQDYPAMSATHPDRIRTNVAHGVPDALRGDIWLAMARAKDPALVRTYTELLDCASPHEKLIQRDLLRTFPKHPFFRQGERGLAALFNLTRAYSLYDIEVGYCQGLAFVAGLVLLNVHNEADAFSLFVKLLQGYGLRQLYTPTMEGLHLFLFQLEQLLQERIPEVFSHLSGEGVHTSMYATEWFMTLFAYRLQLKLVFRILDLILAEGVHILFHFAVALLVQNREHLCTLPFEPLLEFLKKGIFRDFERAPHRLVDAALATHIAPATLAALAARFAQDGGAAGAPAARADGGAEDAGVWRAEHARMCVRVHALEGELAASRQETRELAHALLHAKLELAHAHEAAAGLRRQVAGLQRAKATAAAGGGVGPRKSSRNSDMAALHELNGILTLQLQELQNELLHVKSPSVSESPMLLDPPLSRVPRTGPNSDGAQDPS